ncbi:MAG: CpXC domain-containing protein [Chloroflexi bacterium]|nr:CpXC domain-containing protein [Chloroflexota bacterium]
MSQVVRTTLNCPRCGTAFQAIVEQIIDVGVDPQAKARFLSGRVNMISCPNCGHTLAVGTPLVYHDPSKDLMLIYVPMELNVSTPEREKIVGDLTRRVVDNVPNERRRGYLLQPRMALTLPGMIDTILESDGITADMREAQREKMRVMEMFLQVNPQEWPNVIQQQGALVDPQFLQMILVTAENAAETGKDQMAQALLRLYNFLLQNTTAGQELVEAAEMQEATVQEVAAELEAKGEQLTRADFMEMTLRFAEEDQRLQALVGLMRPALDYQFFQELTRRAEAAQGAEREKLNHLRERLLELTAVIDQQTQMVLQRAADTLRVIINSEDLDAAIRPRMEMIDDTFLAVLQANIRAAEQQQDARSANRLKEVLQTVLEIMREGAPPQVRLINEVLEAPSPDEAQALLRQHAPNFGPELPELMIALAEDLDESEQPEAAQRLRALASFAAQHIKQN